MGEKEKGAKLAGKGILTLIGCAFGNALGKIGNFIKNMFKNLLGKVLNGAVCAVKEFTAGIFSKMFDVLRSRDTGLYNATKIIQIGSQKVEKDNPNAKR